MIPAYLTDWTLWWTLVPIPALAALVGLAIYSYLRFAKPAVTAPGAIVLPLTAFLLLGLVSGYLMGLSRESAVAAVVPAVLTLLGATAAVLVGKAANQAASTRVSGLILLFSLGFLVGSTWGSALRQSVLDFESSEEELIRRSHVELKVREFREELGLPAEFLIIGSTPEKKGDKGK